MTDFQHRFEKIRSELKRDHDSVVTENTLPKPVGADGFEVAKNELSASWDTFKSTFTNEIKIIKWFLLGMLVMISIINIAILNDWAGFLMSPEYQQYKARTK